MFKKYAFIIFNLLTVSLSAYSDLRVCENEPVSDACVEEKFSYKTGESIFFTLLSDKMGSSQLVTFDVYQVVDTIRGEDQFLTSFNLETGAGWNYCYKSIQFNTTGTYKVIAYIGKDYAASATVVAGEN